MGRSHAIVAALSVTVTVSYGVLAYALPVLFVPMEAELGFSRTALAAAASISLATAAVAGVGVGWLLDRRDPRLVMTAGSALATITVLAWSRVEALAALYAVFAVLGFAMAAVTYGPAFTVIAKWIAVRRTAALTVLTVAGAFASLIFSPLTEALASALGWRDAVVVLAIVLGAVTIPLHALVLRPAPRRPEAQSVPARRALRSGGFWLLAAAFALGAFAWSAMTVNLVLVVVDQGQPVAFGALAAGVTGISQLPGRLLYGPVQRRLGEPATLPVALALGALALLVLVLDQSRAAVLAFAVLFGTAAGMQTLLSASVPASLFGVASYGAVAGVLHACINAARAAGPFALAAAAALAGGYLAVVAAMAAGLLAAALVSVFVSTRGRRWSPAPPGAAR